MALWFASRATGLVSLLLFTGALALGVLTHGRAASARWPRFAVATLHRNLALLSVAFLAVHIVSAVADGYVDLRWLDVLLPFGANYQPLWVGLGAVAVDLLLAVIGTSLLRTRLSARAWRAVHWTVYLSWPVAFAHGLGMADTDLGRWWVIGVFVACLAAVAGALILRLFARTPEPLPVVVGAR